MSITKRVTVSPFDKIPAEADTLLLTCPESVIIELGNVVLNSTIYELNGAIEYQVTNSDQDHITQQLIHDKHYASILDIEICHHENWTISVLSELGIKVRNETHDFLYNLEKRAALKVLSKEGAPLLLNNIKGVAAVRKDFGSIMMRKLFIDLKTVLVMVQYRNEPGTSELLSEAISSKTFITNMTLNYCIRTHFVPLIEMLDPDSEVFKFINEFQQKTFNEALEFLKK